MAAAAPSTDVQRIFSEHLERHGHRKTMERFTVLAEVYAMDGHFDIDRLYGHMKRRNHRVSRATLYNTMELLLEARLVRRHQFGQAQAHYEKALAFHQHDHLICDTCGRVMEFCDPRIQSIRTTVAEVMDFEVHHHALHIHGRCKQCRANTPRA